MKNKYCRECGRELQSIEVIAQSIEVHHYDGGGGTYCPLASRFDPETGDTNLARIYQCPNFRVHWYGENNHDRFVEYKQKILWGIKYYKGN